MTYPDSVQFLYALGNEIKTAKFGLERITRLLHELGNPHLGRKAIHIAGTNGKGSVCAMVESALRAGGRRTGLFTSPHLHEPVERIRIGGEPVTPEQFARAFHIVHQAAERLLEAGDLDLHPTYFETLTAMAFNLFAGAGVDAPVLEVGLGGRLDATNVVEPHLCVITPVDFDHEAWLGKSLEAISAEKAGILKPGVTAVFAPQRPEVSAVLEARAADLHVPVRRAEEWQVRDLELHARGSRFAAVGRQTYRIECPLAGEHQVQNALTALVALDALDVPAGAIESGIASTRWPGRLEVVRHAPEILLDGAHNPAGARALAAYLQRFYSSRRVWMIYGAMRDKAVAEMSAILFPAADRVIVTAPAQPRAVRPETILESADHPHIAVAADVTAALTEAAEAAPEDAIVITGSLFLVAEARKMLAVDYR